MGKKSNGKKKNKAQSKGKKKATKVQRDKKGRFKKKVK